MSRKHLMSNKLVAKSGEEAKAFEVDKLAALLEKKEKCEEILGKMEKSGQREVALNRSGLSADDESWQS